MPHGHRSTGTRTADTASPETLMASTGLQIAHGSAGRRSPVSVPGVGEPERVLLCWEAQVRALRMVGARSVVSAIAVVGGIGLLRRWSLGYGSTDEERAMLLPGDEQVPEPDLVSTRAITIQAAPARVWPWLVQLGQGRAGFY